MSNVASLSWATRESADGRRPIRWRQLMQPWRLLRQASAAEAAADMAAAEEETGGFAVRFLI